MIYAAIDIGSNTVDLKVVSYADAAMKEIDSISTDVGIGAEAYTGEHISSGSVLHLVTVLNGYRQLLRDYKVDAYRVIATGAFSNAKNAAQVIEIIRMQTGFEIEILDGPVENYITYKALRDKLPDFERIRKGAVLVDAHSGSTDITIYSKGKLLSNDTVRMGTQIAVPYIEKLISMAGDYPQIMRDYIDSLTRRAQKKIIHRNTDYLLLMGSGATELCERFFGGRRVLTDAEFLAVHSAMTERDYALEKSAGGSWNKLLFLMVLYGIFLEVTGAKQVMIPDVSLSDGIIADLIDRTLPDERRYALSEDDVFDAASEIARRFKCKLRHIRNVEANCLELFDSLRNPLQFGERDRYVLRLAVHIVEIGKALKRSGYERATHDMLRHLDLFGVCREDLDLVAQIALEIENIFSNESNRVVYSVQTRKIATLLAVGLALDITNLQHLRIEEVEVRGKEVRLYLSGADTASTRIAMETVQDAFSDCMGYELLL